MGSLRPMDMIDEDIRLAETLPSRFYTEQSIFESQKDFFEKWQFAAHINDLKENNIIPLDLIEEVNGESMVLVKDEQIHCFSNVCTHRGMRLATKECKAKGLRCMYHGRTFDLEGNFINMPDFDEAMNFPNEQDNLHSFPVSEWNGLLFSAVKAENEFDISYLNSRLSHLDIQSFTRDPERDREHTIDANWALYCENYLEGFHIPYVHPELHKVLEHSEYRVECFDGGVLQIGIAREDEDSFELPTHSPDYGMRVAAYYVWLFPNLMLNFYPWGLSINIVIPLSVNKTKVIYRGYVKNPELLSKGAGKELDTVELQDQWVVEMVQRGMYSSAYDRGRYSPKMEKGVHHFHRMLSREN